MIKSLLPLSGLLLVACATPDRNPGFARVELKEERIGERVDVSRPQDAMEETTDRPKSYVSIGGGLTGQTTSPSTGPDTDTQTINARISGGYRPKRWLDISVGNDVFLTSSETGATTVSTTANNLGVSANYIFNRNAKTEFYAGPNLGLYISSIKAAGLSQSSVEASAGFQVGMRHWLGNSTAIKLEWRNLWAEQDGFSGGSNDVFQSTLIVSFDLSF